MKANERKLFKQKVGRGSRGFSRAEGLVGIFEPVSSGSGIVFAMQWGVTVNRSGDHDDDLLLNFKAFDLLREDVKIDVSGRGWVMCYSGSASGLGRDGPIERTNRQTTAIWGTGLAKHKGLTLSTDARCGADG